MMKDSAPIAVQLAESAPSGSFKIYGLGHRTFATSYLDKGEVTDRVLNVVKNFDKVDQGKVRVAVCLDEARGGGKQCSAV
jgi:hypothetical protein